VAKRAAEIEGVYLLPGLARQDLAELLRNVSVVWSLTGGSQWWLLSHASLARFLGLRPPDAKQDPADEEHFGISVSGAKRA
jgi:hypothetical protein